jgi:hypothetical protein
MFDIATGIVGNMLGLNPAVSAAIGSVVGNATGCGDPMTCAMKAGAAHMVAQAINI